MSEELTLPSDKLANDLNFQQEQFVLGYMANGGNATHAARDAGYAFPDVQGSRLLSNGKVVQYIEALRAERRAQLDLQLREKHWSKDRLLSELVALAEFDLGDVLTEGRIDRSKLKGSVTKALASVEIDGGKTKVKAYDKLAVLRLLAEHLGVTKAAQTNVQVNVDFGERMALRRARALEDR